MNILFAMMRYELKDIIRTKKVVILAVIYAILLIISIRIGKYLELLAFVLPRFRSIVPFQIIMPYYVAGAFVPILAMLATYDSISSGVDSKSIKCLIYRIQRWSILLSKILSSFAMLTLLNAVLFMLPSAQLYNLVRVSYFKESLTLLLLISIYTAFFLGVGMLVSVCFDNPQRSLRYGGLLLIFLLVIVPWMGYTSFLSPLGFILQSADILKKGIVPGYMIYAYAAYSILLIGITYYIFERKDIY